MSALRPIILVASLLAALLAPLATFAQGMFEPGSASAPKYGLPGPICATDLNNLMTPEPFSSGDQHNGFVFGWSYAFHCFRVEPPKLLVGPASLLADKALTQNAYTALDSAPAGNGFRTGLVQYPPQGLYIIWGTLTLQVTTANSLYELEVTMGNSAGAFPSIFTGSPTIVGAAATSCAGGVTTFCQLSYYVPGAQCNAGYGQTCEFRVLVRTSDASGTVKTSSPNTPGLLISSNIIARVGGLGALQ
jgi:hypothetical protein